MNELKEQQNCFMQMCKRIRKDDILPIFDVDENQKVKQLF